MVVVTGPLRGVRAISMGGLGPGPFCGMLLGDLGADVIRVDPTSHVDGPLPVDYTVRRSQRSIALDVKDPAGRDVVRRLASEADAFIDVFRPGVAERLGIGPDELCASKPRLVYARMTGYGQHGPLADHAGHDINYSTPPVPAPCRFSASQDVLHDIALAPDLVDRLVDNGVVRQSTRGATTQPQARNEG
jgi:alpha-methylacyl-CoA racemase